MINQSEDKKTECPTLGPIRSQTRIMTVSGKETGHLQSATDFLRLVFDGKLPISNHDHHSPSEFLHLARQDFSERFGIERIILLTY